MACARLTAAVVAAFAVAAPAHSALAAQKGPQGLRAFTLRASEPVVHTFARTPSFAWNPVRGAKTYQFELSTRSAFGDNSIIWSAKGLKSPATAIPVSLPWMTGKPYALYAHARAVTRKGATSWSATFGFNMRWSATPAPMTPSYPGLLRWTPVEGANAYMIWLVDAGKQFTTNTNMADEREYYTFHQNPAFSSAVHWRVRPLRWLYGETENGLPSVSYGPWSPIYTSFNPPFATGPLKDVATVSSVVSDASALRSHSIMPAFIYGGNTSMWNSVEELYRVEVFTDEDCLNTVFRGAMTGAPAYVPRAVGPLAMPLDVSGITAARTNFIATGTEPDSYTFDSLQVKSTESEGSATPPAGAAAKLGLPGANIVGGAPVDLWDSSYYWTVIPIDAIAKDEVDTVLANPALPGDKTITVANGTGIAAGDALRVGSPIGENAVVESVSGNDITLVSGISGSHFTGEDVVRPGGAVTYREAELTQDACASGRVMSFDKSSEPVVTSQKAPFASGLSPNGKLVAAANKSPRFYGQPLVAWQPAVNADEYEVQWSRALYPWKAAGSVKTPATSTTLALTPGTWYYRVRGLDPHMAGKKQQMSWSTPVRVVVTKPRFRVVRH
jgi:hypothetical protein